MGLVTNLTGALLCYAAGRCGISSLFAMGISFFAFYSFRRKDTTKEQVKEFLTHHAAGGWSEEEGAEWFNHTLSKLWNEYKSDMNESAQKKIQNIMTALMKNSFIKIQVRKVDVGPMPPRLIDFHFCPTARKEVLLETVLEYTGRIRLEINIMLIPGGHLPIPASATIRRLQARVRIKILQDERFGWENPMISFRERPLLEFSLEPIAGLDIMDFPGLRHKIYEVIQQNLDSTFVWPNRYHVYGNADHEYAPPDQKSFHGKVFLRVLRAERLKNADSGKDVSDAYCMVTLCGKSFRTKTVDDDLFPFWWTDLEKPPGLKYDWEKDLADAHKSKYLKEREDALEFVKRGGLEKHADPTKAGWRDVWWCWDVNSEKDDTKIVLEVFDEDKMSQDDSIGSTDANILEWRVDSVQQQEMRLRGVANGALFVEYWLVPKDGLLDKEAFKEPAEVPNMGKDLVRQLVAKDLSLPKRKMLEECTMLLRLVSASNLVNRETAADLAVSDPFVLLHLGTRKFKSNVRFDTLSPEWQEQFVLELKGNTMLLLEVKHFAKKRKAEERFSMGRVKVDITRYDEDVLYDQTFPMKGKGASGDIRLVFMICNPSKEGFKKLEIFDENSKLPFEELLKASQATSKNSSNKPVENVEDAFAALDSAAPLAGSSKAGAAGTDAQLREAAAAVVERGMPSLPEADAEPPLPPLSMLKVKVIKCENLKNIERFGKSDPFVKLLFEGVKHKTQVKWDNLNPEYNESFEWSLEDLEVGKPLPELQIRVCDKERIGKSRPLGNYNLDLASIRELDKVLTQELTLDSGDGGKIYLEVEIVSASIPDGVGEGVVDGDAATPES